MKALVGVTGRAGSGKSTLARFLAGHGFVEVAIADPVKQGLAAMLGIPRAAMEDPDLKAAPLHPYGVTPRQLMQTLGTEWGRRHVGEDVWVKRLESRLVSLWSEGFERIVVSDVRMENEAEFIRSAGGLLVHVLRKASGARGGVAGHDTEKGLEPARGDLVIANEGSLADLQAAAERIAACFAARKPAGDPILTGPGLP